MFAVLIVTISQLSAFSVRPALAETLDGRALVSERCASCHDLTGPAPRSYQGVVDRKAPDLFYAGSKFNRPWLVEWLQNPTVIRPAGVMFLNHVVSEDRRDRIKDGGIRPCPADLSVEEAEAVSDYLMTLTDPVMRAGVVDSEQKLSELKAYQAASLHRVPSHQIQKEGNGRHIRA
jgi:mono/diheme cytochrome c family protein